MYSHLQVVSWPCHVMFVIMCTALSLLNKLQKKDSSKSPEQRKRRDLDSTRIHADEKAVTRISSTLDSMLNPFDTHHDGIVCLSSGTVAVEEIQKDFLAAPDKGEKAV